MPSPQSEPSKHKIAGLVRIFEEQASPSSGRAHPSSGHRRASTPVDALGGANRPLRDRAPVLRASSLAAPLASDNIVSADTPDRPSWIPLPIAAPRPAWRPPRPSPAPPQTSAKNVTTVKTSQAVKAIADKLEATSEAVFPGVARASPPAYQTPPPVKDRFRRPQGVRVAHADSGRGDNVSNAGTPGRAGWASSPDSVGSPATNMTFSTLLGHTQKPKSRRASAKLADEGSDIALVDLPGVKCSRPDRPAMPPSTSFGKLSTYTMDVPSYKVLAQDSQPLDLPLLDDYISSLPPPKFSDPEKILTSSELVGWREWLSGKDEQTGWWGRLFRLEGSQPAYQRTSTQDNEDVDHLKTHSVEYAKRQLIFPPMHLIPPDLTVTDLKANRKKRAPFLTLNQLLSTGIDAVLGAEGSSYAISLMKVEAFRDLIQLIGLGVEFALPSGGLGTSTVQITQAQDRSRWKTVVLSVIPSVLGLDFVTAFGHAILWLWVFTLICFLLCWEFKIMVGGLTKKPESIGEGYENEQKTSLAARSAKISGAAAGSWLSRLRRRRGYRIAVIFVITSLYVPLSKISIGALVWTSDFWAIENYYASTDSPEVSSLGALDVFRDPLDFCYTTSMRRAGFNWAIPILIVAAVTVLVVTIWFPLRLWSVVRREVPRVDPYTELGERRKDIKAEYERLLQHDKSAFSFVYNRECRPDKADPAVELR